MVCEEGLWERPHAVTSSILLITLIASILLEVQAKSKRASGCTLTY